MFFLDYNNSQRGFPEFTRKVSKRIRKLQTSIRMVHVKTNRLSKLYGMQHL